MSAPTFNKYRSTTIYGALKTRDFTNSSGSTVLEAASVDLSGNFLSRGDSTFTKKVVCNALLADINANNVLCTKEYVDSAVSGGGTTILGSANAWTNTNTYNSYFPTSTLPTSTAITTSSIVNKGMNDTLYAGLGSNNTFTGTNYFSEATTISGIGQNGTTANYLDNLTLGGDATSGSLELAYNAGITQTGTATNTLKNLTLGDSGLIIKDLLDNVVITIETLGITQSDIGATNTYDGESIFNGTLTTSNGLFPDSIDQVVHIGEGNLNNFIRTKFLEQVETSRIFRVNTTNNTTYNTVMRSAEGDYPYILSAGSQVLYTTPQAFTITAQQTIAGSQISINQTTTTATNTANYSIANSIISTFTIPNNFSKAITLNIPISIRNAGSWTLSGTALSATITNTINSMTANIYVNGILYDTNPAVEIQDSNSSTRSTQISYTTTGTKTISLDQYFFNINFDLYNFFNNTYISRDNSITNTLQIVLSANITNTITRVSNTGNFTATNTLTFVSNTGVSTISNTSTASTSISYSPNSNGTNYAAATSTPNYIDTTNTTGGTSYTNHLRANSFNLLPVGMVVQWVSATAPTGWLLCNGNAYNASANKTYQELYNVIGNQFGGTNNTNFKVPDYRGMFLRGAGQNAQTGYTTYTGQTLNTQQTHATQTHSHTIDHDHENNSGPRHKFRIRSDGLSGVGFDIICSYPTNTNYTATGLTVPTHSGSSGNNTINIDANETRPVSYSVNYLIKY